jgi:hypothetical protein
VPAGQRVLVVGDREAEIYELFALPRRDGVDLLVRASEDRRVFAPERQLWAAAEAAPVIGEHQCPCTLAMKDPLARPGCRSV